jgi:hypothetical protein
MSHIQAHIDSYSERERMYIVRFDQGDDFMLRVVSQDDLNRIGQGTLREIETFTPDMIDVLHLAMSDENTRSDRVLNPETLVGLTLEIDD